MNNLKQKLSSRKLWAAILAALAAIIVALCGEELTPEIISALKCAVSAAVAYIFGEGAVDIARIIADAIKANLEAEAKDVIADGSEADTE